MGTAPPPRPLPKAVKLALACVVCLAVIWGAVVLVQHLMRSD